MTSFVTTLLYLLLFSQSAWSFINIESLRQIEGDGADGKTRAQLSGKNGNTEKTIGQMDSTNLYKSGNHEFLGLLKYQYGETTKVKDTNNGSAHLRYTKKIKAWFFAETFVQTQFNEFQGLIRRDLLGLGARFQVIKTEKNFLFIGAGGFHESESLANGMQNSAFRGNLYISYLNQFAKNSEVSAIVYYQPAVVDTRDFRVQFQFEFDYEVFENLSLVQSLNVAHDSRPPDDVNKNDLSYLSGIAVKY